MFFMNRDKRRRVSFKEDILLFYGSARGVMVIVVGNEHGDTSSNPGRH